MADAGKIGMAAGGCCCLCCVIFVIVFIATGIKTIEQTEWCLQYNWWTQSVNPDPLTEPGVTFIGMGNYFVHYPNTNKYVYFRDFGERGSKDGDIYRTPVAVRTKDGLDVRLNLDLIYRLQPQNLHHLYQLVGEGTEELPAWHSILVHVSEGIIDNLATLYEAQAFYTNRTQVAKAFEDQLRVELSEKLFIDLEQLQMHDAEFPKAYDQKIKDTLSQQQNVQGAVQRQQKEIIDKQGELSQETELAGKAIVTAQGDAEQVAVGNQAKVDQYLLRTLKEAEGYQRSLEFFHSNGAINSVDTFLNYMKVKALQEHSADAVTFKVR